jgi:hypothetical protein
MAECNDKADAFIRTHHHWYAVVTVRRVVFFWSHFWCLRHYYLEQEPDDPVNVVFNTIFTLLTLIGLWRAFRVNRPVAVLYGLVLLFFPAMFYFTHVEVYYRRQIDPMMVVLAVYGVVGMAGRKASKIQGNSG